MVEAQNCISAEELFGTACRLVAHGGEAALSGVASLGGLYQAAVGIVALLFIFVVINYYEIIRHIVVASFRNRKDNLNIHIYSSEVHNIEIITGLMGVLLLALCTMRFSVVAELQPYLAPLLSYSRWEVGGLTIVALLALIFGVRIALYIVGIVSECVNFYNAIWHSKMLCFSTTMVLISPMLILLLLSEGLSARIALFTSVAVCSIVLILSIKDSFLLFRAQRFSIFHWILYLCALEIFPLSLLLAPIARG